MDFTLFELLNYNDNFIAHSRFNNTTVMLQIRTQSNDNTFQLKGVVCQLLTLVLLLLGLVDPAQATTLQELLTRAAVSEVLSIYPEAGFAIAVLGNQSDWPRFELERDIRNQLFKGELQCSVE